MLHDVAAVVIGRNEGPRLRACLASLRDAARIVYVDSGSQDDSLTIAALAGAELVELDTRLPFTAARARNAGFVRLYEGAPPRFVQFVDGDCELRDGWLAKARAFLESHSRAAVVCGRRRERHPAASVFNRLCDSEWDTPVGPAKACGGDAMMRAEAVAAVGGYRDDMIAGEEPELCLRLRAAGWQVWRLEAEMTWHDAAITRLSQWARRARRAGHAFAEGAHLHGAPPERHWVAETRRALAWGLAVPGGTLAGAALAGPWAFLLLAAYPLQVLRLTPRLGAETALFTMLAKFPEAAGVLGFHLGRLRRRRPGLIEYK